MVIDCINLHAQFTGDAPFPAWRPAIFKDVFPKNQIQVHPRYPLMPEASGEAIAVYSKQVLKVFGNGQIRKELIKKFPKIDLPESRRCICSSSSAGACIAFLFTWFRQAFDIRVDLLILPSSMPEAYTRKVGGAYGSHTVPTEQLAEWGPGMFAEGAGRRTSQRANWSYGRDPPEFMSVYPITAVGTRVELNGGEVTTRCLWAILYAFPSIVEWLEQVLLRVKPTIKLHREQNSPSIILDAGTLAKRIGSKGMEALGLTYSAEDNCFAQYTFQIPSEVPSSWPTTFIAHGTADDNCRIQGAIRMKELLLKLFPDGDVRFYEMAGMAHGFDQIYPKTRLPFIEDLVKYLVALKFNHEGG